MTATTRFCQCCTKLISSRVVKFRSLAFSTSQKSGKDEDGKVPLKTNPFFMKYSKKLSSLLKTTPGEINRRIAPLQNEESSHPSIEQLQSKTGQSSSFTKKRSLDDVVKVNLLKHKTTQEITEIWLKHHSTVRDTIAIVIPAEVYKLILVTSADHPTFLLPLPREHGYEFFVSQVWGNEFHLTPLINFQAFKENAPECLTLSHFIDLSQDKGIVLMQGEFNNEVLNISEAMCLANQLHRYYGEIDPKRHMLLRRFTNAPSEFHHMDLIVELERMVK